MSTKDRFTYHQPTDGQIKMCETLHEVFALVASAIEIVCINSREKSLAITKLQEASMWADEAIYQSYEEDA